MIFRCYKADSPNVLVKLFIVRYGYEVFLVKRQGAGDVLPAPFSVKRTFFYGLSSN
jgi:hypothetical protein